MVTCKHWVTISRSKLIFFIKYYRDTLFCCFVCLFVYGFADIPLFTVLGFRENFREYRKQKQEKKNKKKKIFLVTRIIILFLEQKMNRKFPFSDIVGWVYGCYKPRRQKKLFNSFFHFCVCFFFPLPPFLQ